MFKFELTGWQVPVVLIIVAFFLVVGVVEVATSLLGMI